MRTPDPTLSQAQAALEAEVKASRMRTADLEASLEALRMTRKLLGLSSDDEWDDVENPAPAAATPTPHAPLPHPGESAAQAAKNGIAVSHGTVSNAVAEAIDQMPGRFTIRDIQKSLVRNGHILNGMSVRGAILRNEARGNIAVVSRGTGSKPSVFVAVKQGEIPFDQNITSVNQL